jgi:hypothetical protein
MIMSYCYCCTTAAHAALPGDVESSVPINSRRLAAADMQQLAALQGSAGFVFPAGLDVDGDFKNHSNSWFGQCELL